MKKLIIILGFILVNNNIFTLYAQNTFTDVRDNQTYKTVRIGNQIWMAENLNFKTDSGSWIYDNLSENASIYGRLYTWETANEVCPIGWHLPSNIEWTELLIYINNGQKKDNEKTYLVANKMKQTGIFYWYYTKNGRNYENDPNVTNLSGFTAIPAGMRDTEGYFYFKGGKTFFWSSSKKEKNHFNYGMDILVEDVLEGMNWEPFAFSVRCVKDR